SFFFSSRRRHTRFSRDWSSDVCSSDLRSRSRARALLRIVTTSDGQSGRKSQKSGNGKCKMLLRVSAPSPARKIFWSQIISHRTRSEERRVGKECKSRWTEYQKRKNNNR